MANETYFKNFNTIKYGNSSSNVAVVDITERIVTLQNIQNNPYIYYPLDITDGTRADQIANLNYNDPYSSWILYLSNGVTDPYYDWYLTPEQFNQFITIKYGSIANSQQQVAFWRNNWIDQPSLTPSEYNVLISSTPNIQKYWAANVNFNGTPISYYRTPFDWTATTNMLVEYSISTTIPFVQNELLVLNSGEANVGVAQYVTSNSSVIIVNNLQSNQTINVPDFPKLSGVSPQGSIISMQSGNVILVNGYGNSVGTNTALSVTTLIPPVEQKYWSPVYYYDMENEKNEGNKTINVMQPNYVPQFIKNTKDLLSQ